MKKQFFIYPAEEGKVVAVIVSLPGYFVQCETYLKVVTNYYINAKVAVPSNYIIKGKK